MSRPQPGTPDLHPQAATSSGRASDPQITTIYPAGPLPAQCPAGMVALGSYGSCDAWAGELALDVLSAHLIAPYANILISATPADTQETDGPASNVAMPEIMKGVEVIAANHLANVISISDGNGESSYSAGAEEITAQDPGELAAATAGIPVLVGTGDCGVVQNLPVANSQCGQPDAVSARHYAGLPGRHVRIRPAAERGTGAGHPAQWRPERRPGQPGTV